jgi:hypothetical protein
MNFSQMNRSIVEANASYAFALSPTSFAIELAQSRDLPDACAGCERFDVGDFPKDLKVHGAMVANLGLGVNGKCGSGITISVYLPRREAD